VRLAVSIGAGALALVACAVAVVVLVGARLPVAHVASRSETFAVPRTKLGELSLAAFGRGNDGSYAIVEQDAPNRFVTEITNKSLPFGGSWTYDLTDEGGGSRLTVVERGYVYNPVFRFISRYVIGHTRSLDAYFAALAQSAGGKPGATT
jgi:hypothetical protein